MNKNINTFNYDGDTYEIHLGNNKTHPRIINLRTENKPSNQKEVLRRVLYNMGYDVPTGSHFTTHDAIRLLYKLLNGIELNERETQQRNRN